MTPNRQAIFFVTDIEADGPSPAEHSMMSFATVACTQQAGIIDSFEAVVAPRKDRAQDSFTMDWWKTQPEAYKAATDNPRDAKAVMEDFADWVDGFAGYRIFASSPLLLDAGWIDEYLRTFVGTRIFRGPFKFRRVFDGSGLDIPTYFAGLFGWPAEDADRLIHATPASWRGDVKHTHRAIDDATGYANMLLNALKISAERDRHPLDFARHAT